VSPPHRRSRPGHHPRRPTEQLVQMTFAHELYPEPPELEMSYGEDGKRYYKTPTGNLYKSVTTIIGERSDKSWLRGWRDRVGEDEADQILFQAQERGTAIHSIAERYV